MNILLASAGRRSYMVTYFKEALKGLGEVHASNSVYTYTLRCADKYVVTPNIYDSTYIEFLLDYCIKHEIKAIISLFDIDLPILAKNKALFEKNGIKVIVSDYPTTQICNDKWKTHEFLAKNRINHIPSFIDLEDAKISLRNGSIHYPLIIKPRWGMGSIGIYKVNNDDELDVLYKKLNSEIFDTYLKYESSETSNKCILIQEFITGQEVGLEVLNDLNGNYVTSVAKKKLAMRSGETDIAEIIDPAPFQNIAKSLSNELKHIAVLDVDCFITADNTIYVLEMNCRFGGQYPFTHNAGAHFPKQIIAWLNGESTNVDYITPNVGVRSCKDIVPVVF